MLHPLIEQQIQRFESTLGSTMHRMRASESLDDLAQALRHAPSAPATIRWHTSVRGATYKLQQLAQERGAALLAKAISEALALDGQEAKLNRLGSIAHHRTQFGGHAPRMVTLIERETQLARATLKKASGSDPQASDPKVSDSPEIRPRLRP